MSDQFDQNPEEELPDWLKELRGRGSIEDEAEEAQSGDAEAEEETPAWPQMEEAEATEDEGEEEAAEAESLAEEQEPDWLLEIRRRHQGAATEAEDEPSAVEEEEGEEESDEAAELEEKAPEKEGGEGEEQEETQWAPSPIMEVPVEPAASEEEGEESEEAEQSAETEREEAGEAELAADRELEMDAEDGEGTAEAEGAADPGADPEGETDSGGADESEFIEAAMGEEAADEQPAEDVGPDEGEEPGGDFGGEAIERQDEAGSAAIIEEDIESEPDSDEAATEDEPFEGEGSYAALESWLASEREGEEAGEDAAEETESAEQGEEDRSLEDGEEGDAPAFAGEALGEAESKAAPEDGDEWAESEAQEAESADEEGDAGEAAFGDEDGDGEEEAAIEDEAQGAEAQAEWGEEEGDAPAAEGDTEQEIEAEAEEGLDADGEQDYDELMSWLSEEAQPEEEDSAEPQPFSTAQDQDLEPAELPDWLKALKPSEEESSDEAEDRPTGTDRLYEAYYPDEEDLEGPLDGLSGILAAEPEIAQYGRAKIPTGQLSINKGQMKHAANFEAVLEREGAPIEDHGRRIALPLRFLRMLFAGLIALAVLIPLVSGSQNASRAALGSLPESTAFFNQIDLLPANVPVLVAFEVQPGLYGEMKAPASAVLNHLLDRQARLVFISTQPTGPALAEKLLREELGSQPSVSAGDYVNLGYLSGGTAALRYFAANPREATLLPQLWETPILESIRSIANFGVVVVITGDADEGRAWIEQVSPFTSDGLFALSSAQAAPLLRPYLNSDPVTVRSLVAGLSGASYYESLRNRDGLGREYWDAYSFGLGAMTILILFGGLYGRLIQMRPERRPAGTDKEDSNAG